MALAVRSIDRQAVKSVRKVWQRGECEAVLAGGEGRVSSLGAMLGLGAARWVRRPLACRRAALWGVGLGRAWTLALKGSALPDSEGGVTFSASVTKLFGVSSRE